MRKLGKKQLTLQLRAPLDASRRRWPALPLELAEDGHTLVYTFDTQTEETGIAALLKRLARTGHRLQGPAFERKLAGRHLRQPGPAVPARQATHAPRLHEAEAA